MSLGSIDTVVLLDRMHAITRLTAEDRLLHFIMSLKAKIDHCSLQESDRILLPFSQKEIGDALGLTPIYVNRLLKRLEKSGDLTRSRPYVRLNNRKTWEERLNFRNRYAEFDVNLINAS
ncbi:Crp/Fnr family transcriptional regulator [Loktanella sp. M215]|uniref:Crp/Fnr family transcriptional regulator n=1 Tax=Loktanella sp. M215 TaxID=2675431 RepID=UPI001F029F72|nr:helix-turn-helix domain-containing protein [Loktanella sp. M215]MCF7701742.1 helix-turn-helix domain-containing protein [Loktanella sp. M215]